jgi:hypothetical protein
VLGAAIERYVFISVRLEGLAWLYHPVVLAFFAIALYGLLGPFVRRWRANRGKPAAARKEQRGLVFHTDDLFPLGLLIATAILFYMTLSWSASSALVPRIICGVVFFSVLASLLQSAWGREPVGLISVDAVEDDALKQIHAESMHMDTESDTDHMPPRLVYSRAMVFFGWLVAFMASMAVIGLIPTVPLFVIAFMRLEAREPWKLILPQAIGLTLFVWVLFDQMLTLPWPPTLLGALLPGLAEYIPSM